jgi:AhpD family alkylhydroperoxidase
MRRLGSLVLVPAAAGIVLLASVLPNTGSARQESAHQEAQVLVQYRQQHGYVPKALKLMVARGEVLTGFMSYGKAIFDGGPLSDKERSLVALSAAVALKSSECIAAHSTRARKAGASDDEIIQAMLIAGLLSNTSALHVAHGAAALAGN